MLPDFLHAHKDLGLLSSAVEMNECAAVGVGIIDVECCAIPSGALVVADIGIYRVAGIEAVWKRHGHPCDIVRGFVAAPDFPEAAKLSLMEFPARSDDGACFCKAQVVVNSAGSRVGGFGCFRHCG